MCLLFNTRLDGNTQTCLPHIYDRKLNFRTSQEQIANVPVLLCFVAKLLPEKKQLIMFGVCNQVSAMQIE